MSTTTPQPHQQSSSSPVRAAASASPVATDLRPPSDAATAAASTAVHAAINRLDPSTTAIGGDLDGPAQSRCAAVLEPSGRSQLELYAEQMRAQATYLSLVVREWPMWRVRVSRLVRFNAWFERVVFALICLNALTIVLDSVVESSRSPASSLRSLELWVDVLDNFVTWAFVLEMLL